MRIDDHNQVLGGQPNALTVWLSTEEINQLLKGQFLQAENDEGTRIIVGVNDVYSGSQPVQAVSHQPLRFNLVVFSLLQPTT